MIVETNTGYTKIILSDKQLSVLLSVLDVVTDKWNELKGSEETTTAKDLTELTIYILERTILENQYEED